MAQAILAGGPEHGRRLELRDGVKEYVTVAAHGLQPEPAFVPARPPWWQPLRRRRWNPPAIPEPSPFTQCSYRRDGELGDGTRVYWFAEGLSRRPPEEGRLAEFLADTYYTVPPRRRHDGTMRWVMDLKWHNKCRELKENGVFMMMPEHVGGGDGILLGLPVTVTDDGGVPHLEVSR